MLALQSLASLALATTLLRSGPPLHTVTARHTTPTAADPAPLVLTSDLVQRIAIFMSQVRQDSVHFRTLAADSANYAYIVRMIGPFRVTPKFPGWGVIDTLLDFGAVAAKDAIVAAAFERAHVAPAQYRPFAMAVQCAVGTDAMESYLLEKLRVSADTADSAAVLWQNVAFLRAHRTEINALGLPLPPSLPFTHFLDTTQHTARIRVVAYSDKQEEPWPWGFLDSTNAPSGSAAAAPLRVLFIGNSLTYVNSMPQIFGALAAQGLKRRVVVGLVSIPGAAPMELWATTDVLQVMTAMPWDAVVVQLKPAGNHTRTLFPYYARLFTQAITAHHAQAVFWTQWLYPEVEQRRGASWQPRLDSALTASATAAGAVVAPIAQAFAAVRQMSDSTWHTLFRGDDDAHPRALGSYLQALVVYRTLTGRSPIGLPRTTGALTIPVIGTLTVPEQTATLLQNAAATAKP